MATADHSSEYVSSGSSPGDTAAGDAEPGMRPGCRPEGTPEPRAPRDILPIAIPAKRKRGKSLSRRTGQDGYIEKSGRWFVVRFWKDVPGQEKRIHIRERVCPISGPGLLSRSARKRKAREILKRAVRTPLNTSRKL